MFWKIDELVRRKIGSDGEPADEKGKSFLLRYYRVLSIEQCHDLKALYGDDRKPVNPIAECESIVAAMPNRPQIEQHSQAFYRPSADMVGMPSRNSFESPEAYYSSLSHELTHSTGHKSSLNRFEENATDHQFGSESYAKKNSLRRWERRCWRELLAFRTRLSAIPQAICKRGSRDSGPIHG
jgi:antirestriction protein ArdC